MNCVYFELKILNLVMDGRLVNEILFSYIDFLMKYKY